MWVTLSKPLYAPTGFRVRDRVRVRVRVRVKVRVCVRTSRPNHSPEPGPIEVASRKCRISLTCVSSYSHGECSGQQGVSTG